MQEISLQDKAEMLLELFGNTLVRSKTAEYLEQASTHLIDLVSVCQQSRSTISPLSRLQPPPPPTVTPPPSARFPLLQVTDPAAMAKQSPLLRVDALKFRQRDELEDVLNFWRNRRKRKDFDIVKLWDERVRGLVSGQGWEIGAGLAAAERSETWLHLMPPPQDVEAEVRLASQSCRLGLLDEAYGHHRSCQHHQQPRVWLLEVGPGMGEGWNEGLGGPVQRPHLPLRDLSPHPHNREHGVAFSLREADYDVPNRTLGSKSEGRVGGRTVTKIGYWGDIVCSPFLAFGLECENEEMLKKANSKHVKVCAWRCWGRGAMM